MKIMIFINFILVLGLAFVVVDLKKDVDWLIEEVIYESEFR